MKNKKIRIPLIVALSLIGLYFLIIKPFITDPVLLNKYHRFTVGVVKDKSAPANGDVDAVIFFYVNGKRYRATVGLGNFGHKVSIGNSYIVKFYPGNPKNCQVMTDKRVPDPLAIPPDGWAELP